MNNALILQLVLATAFILTGLAPRLIGRTPANHLPNLLLVVGVAVIFSETVSAVA